MTIPDLLTADWPPQDATTITGWRFESIDTQHETRRGASFMTTGDETTLGHTMFNMPDGGWSAPAVHLDQINGIQSRWYHPDTAAPIPGCCCGFRVCRWFETAWVYMFPKPTTFQPRDRNTPIFNTNARGLVLVRVEAKGSIYPTDPAAEWNLTLGSCANVQQIRPAWPAYTVDANAAERMRHHYGTDAIHTVRSWPDLLRRWNNTKAHYRKANT
jgi:hypothetical protein